MVASEFGPVIEPVGIWKGQWGKQGRVTPEKKHPHAHHGAAQSFVSYSEAFTTSDLLATVGGGGEGLLGGSAREIRTAQCASR
jgi:hypothetical protein